MTKLRNITALLIGLFLSQILVPSATILSGADSQANSHTAFASNENETTIYYHADHLSGSHIITDEDGNVIEATDYLSFGEIRTDEKLTNYENDYKYTGKELDDSGLYYYGARYYDPAIGKFLSADPWGGDITNPQSLNKYSYVLNNPLRYTDPSGKCVEDACVGEVALLIGFIEFGINLVGAGVAQSAKESAVASIPSVTISTSASNFNITDVTKYYAGQFIQSQGSGATAEDSESAQNPASDLGWAGQTVGPGGMEPDDDENEAKTIIKTNAGEFELSNHALKQMGTRGVSRQQVINAINNSKPFKYFHENTWKIGYYDKVSNIFVGAGDKITTVINNVSRRYIKNLMRIIPRLRR